MAGGIWAQANAYVNLGTLGLDRAATVLIILVLGGHGRLYGAFIGAVAYMVLSHFLSKIYPTAWQLGLGLLLVVIALFARNGIVGIAEAAGRAVGQRGPHGGPLATGAGPHGPRRAIPRPAVRGQRTAMTARVPTPRAAHDRSCSRRAICAEISARWPPPATSTFSSRPGARHALIGPNGAGKTTFVNLLTGVIHPTSGQVRLKGRDITGVAQAERVKLGIARTFQINRLFRGLSVLDNVYIAVAERVGAAPSMFRPAGRRRDVVEESMHLLETLKLANDASHRISELPYGRQRLVELAIALGLRPEVLLLDEPAAGVPSAESHIILDAIDGLPEHIGVLIIDHDMDLVFRFAKRITVMVSGAVFASGSPQEIGANPDVRAVYLGGGPRTGPPHPPDVRRAPAEP